MNTKKLKASILNGVLHKSVLNETAVDGNDPDLNAESKKNWPLRAHLLGLSGKVQAL